MIAALPLISSALSMLSPTDAPSTAAASRAMAGSGADFGQVLAKMSTETTESIKKAEALSVDGLQGKANLQSVVQAVMTAQEDLQAALAIRDKAVGAFTEISHMSI